MEKLVRVKNQSALMTREYDDQRSGEKKKFYSVALTLSDGLDEFVAELTGDAALQAPTLDPNLVYRVSCYLSVRTWKNQQGVEQYANSVTIRQIKAV